MVDHPFQSRKTPTVSFQVQRRFKPAFPLLIEACKACVYSSSHCKNVGSVCVWALRHHTVPYRNCPCGWSGACMCTQRETVNAPTTCCRFKFPSVQEEQHFQHRKIQDLGQRSDWHCIELQSCCPATWGYQSMHGYSSSFRQPEMGHPKTVTAFSKTVMHSTNKSPVNSWARYIHHF